MNNLKSTLLGWGALIVGAGGSYYAARKWVNERRVMQEAQGKRSSEKLDWRSKIEREEKLQHSSSPSASASASSAAGVSSPALAVGDGARTPERGPS